MKELILYKGLKKTRLLLYTDIDQLSAERFSKINKYWMLDDELGNSFEDIDKIHITRILLSLDDKDKARRVVDNLRVLIHNIINEVNPESLAFMCLIHSIDGEELIDLSEDNLKAKLKLLSDRGLMYVELKKKTKEIREGIYAELESFFPEIFTNVLSVAFWSKIKQRTLKILEGIAENKNVDEEILSGDRYFATLIKPKKLTGRYTDEIRYEHGFESNCIVLSKFINQPVKTLNTKEYFSLIQFYNEQQKRR
jgi:hypothetical protein